MIFQLKSGGGKTWHLRSSNKNAATTAQSLLFPARFLQCAASKVV